jgi:predicted nucleic acid-binding protein
MSAPDLIAAEVANVLWKHVARGDLGAGDAGRAIAVFAEADLALFPAMPLMERARSIAIDLGHPAYDCFYLALADQLGVPLVTSDSRLIRAAHGKGFAKVVALASLAS